MLCQGLNLGRAVQIDMGDQPDRRRPFVARLQHLHQVRAAPRLADAHESQPGPRQHRLAQRKAVHAAKADPLARDVLVQPLRKRRPAVGLVHADEPVLLQLGLALRQPHALGIGLAAIERHRLARETLHHVVGLVWRGTGAQRHMRLAIFQPEQPRPGQIAHDQAGMPGLEIGQRRHHHRRVFGQRGHHQLAGDILALPLQPRHQLVELVICGLRHPQQILARFGRGIAARMALEQLDPQPCLQRVDMADHGGMMHPQHLGGAAHRAHAGHLIGGAYLVPIVHPAPPCLCVSSHLMLVFGRCVRNFKTQH